MNKGLRSWLDERSVAGHREDLKHTHERLTNALVEGRDQVLCSMVMEFECSLPFMLAGAWSPFTDLFGNELQHGYVDELLEQIFLSSFAGNKHSYICISWVDQVGAPGQVIADQIRKLPSAFQAFACLQFAVKHVENIFYNPVWFAGLSPDQRKLLDTLAVSGLDIIGSVPEAEISLNLTFDLPEVMRVSFAGDPQ